MEALMKNGKGVITESKSSFANSDISSHTPPFRMSPYERNTSSRTSLYSPSGVGQPTIMKYNSTDDKTDTLRSSDGFRSELRGSRRLLQKQGSGMDYALGNPNNQPQRVGGTIEHSNTEQKMPAGTIRRSQNSSLGISKFTLPDLTPKGNNVLPPIAGTNPGFNMGGYQPSVMAVAKPVGRRLGHSQRDYPLSDTNNKPPLFKKASETVREGSKFSDDPIVPGGRYRSTYQTQSDFKTMQHEMNSSTGMTSNLNTVMTGSTVPRATFEISTTNYDMGSKLKKKDTLDEEIKKFNLR